MATKDLAGKTAAMASEIEPPCGADHEKPNSDSEFESCHYGSDYDKSDSDSAADSHSTFKDVLATMDSEKPEAYFGRATHHLLLLLERRL